MKRFLGLLAVTALLSACAQVGTTNEYHLLFKPEDHVNKLLRENNPNEAVRIFTREVAYFATNVDDEDIQVSLRQLYSVLEPKIIAINELPGSIEEVQREDWANIKARLVGADFNIASIELVNRTLFNENMTWPLVKTPERNPNRAKRIVTHLRENLPTAVKHQFITQAVPSGANILTEYPIEIEAAPLLAEAYPEIASQLEAGPFNALSTFHGHYAEHLSDKDRAHLGRTLWSSACATSPAESPKTMLCKAKRLGQHKLLTDAHVRVHVPLQIVTKYATYLTAADLRVGWFDLKPLVVSETEATAPYVLLYGGGDIEEATKTMSRNQKSGRYQSGTQTVTNPDYTRQDATVKQRQLDYQAALNKAREEQSDYAICMDGDAADLCRKPTWAKRNLEKIQQKASDAIDVLGRTSPTKEIPLYTKYTYTQITQRNITTSTFRVVLFDREKKRYWLSEFDFDDHNDYAEFEGLRADDIDFKSYHWNTDNDFPMGNAKMDEYDLLLYIQTSKAEPGNWRKAVRAVRY